MISQLRGVVSQKSDNYVVLDVGGVGYKVFCTSETIKKTKENEKVTLLTHLAVRENALDLYAFISNEELSFFELLITIPGIGPKSALNILNVVSLETLRKAVNSGNVAHLVKISGIGRKTAEKIVLELQGKIGSEKEFDGAHLKEESDAVEALAALGYNQREAREALKNVPGEISGTSERVKHALKTLGKQ